MEQNFIEFNGTLINTRYIKRIFKTENRHIRSNHPDVLYYEIRLNLDGLSGTHVETYAEEKDRNDRFYGLTTLLCTIL